MFNFVCQLAPSAHEFQISFFGCQVLGFLGRHVTFDSFDAEPFRSCRHSRQREEIFDVPVVGTRHDYLIDLTPRELVRSQAPSQTESGFHLPLVI
jgi:hypothetical protein